MQPPAFAPEPGADALAHSGRLAAHIRAGIAAAGGWISFARYMELALYAPGLGYYAAGATKFGAAGDFVTAPEISALFGRSVARQVAQVLRASSPQVLEFGAGTGKLAADLLNTLGEACAGYAILEPSPDLRQRQADTLRRLAPDAFAKVRWLDTLPAQFSGCIVANEVADAMPVHLLHIDGDAIDERGVTLDSSGRFSYADRPAQGAVLAAAQALALEESGDYVTEINLAARAWVASLAGCLTDGAALIIDYGFPAREYYHPQRLRGTLMCHYRHHAHDNPFLLPGLQDITAHVDFSALADASEEAGLPLLGYTSQAAFLLDCGITDLLAAVPAADSARYLPLANQANRLLSPAEMGELFKVMLLGREGIEAPLGFRSGDRSRRL
ncbi:MAG TPA: class I SAM-dependent methyltransferase [Burkholderiales bacterium]|jgi:SAM-dependent MidA family methyltransferase|nr:class I SAM-dependent methyltransferase [Burkholderiales bacterium]